jgi:hypothetical protein
VVVWFDPLLKSNRLISLELETGEKEDIAFTENKLNKRSPNGIRINVSFTN